MSGDQIRILERGSVPHIDRMEGAKTRSRDEQGDFQDQERFMKVLIIAREGMHGQ